MGMKEQAINSNPPGQVAYLGEALWMPVVFVAKFIREKRQRCKGGRF
jgi:hypothetical protein